MSVGRLGETLWAANAHVDLTGKNFHFAALDPTTAEIMVPTQPGVTCVGVVYEEAALGQPATIQLSGIGKVVCGAQIVAGTRVCTDASGQAVPSSHTEFECGTALTGGASGEIISVYLDGGRSKA
jgi:hypothetical protein